MLQFTRDLCSKSLDLPSVQSLGLSEGSKMNNQDLILSYSEQRDYLYTRIVV